MQTHQYQIEAIERATLAAVGAATVHELPGWLLGLEPGTVGRAHSAVPLQHAAPDEALIPIIEARYAAHGLSPVFRLPLVASFKAARTALMQRGYASVQPTLVQVGSAGAMAAQFSGSGAELAATPCEGWVSVFLGEGFDPINRANRDRLLSRATGAVFASVRVDGRLVAAGVGCFSHAWASIHGLRTALGHRGQGLAGSILGALAQEAQARQIESVFLQVEAVNSPALALYRRAGFATAWTYEYWRKAKSPSST